jgi:hypothetical protein
MRKIEPMVPIVPLFEVQPTFRTEVPSVQRAAAQVTDVPEV